MLRSRARGPTHQLGTQPRLPLGGRRPAHGSERCAAGTANRAIRRATSHPTHALVDFLAAARGAAREKDAAAAPAIRPTGAPRHQTLEQGNARIRRPVGDENDFHVPSLCMHAGVEGEEGSHGRQLGGPTCRRRPCRRASCRARVARCEAAAPAAARAAPRRTVPKVKDGLQVLLAVLPHPAHGHDHRQRARPLSSVLHAVPGPSVRSMLFPGRQRSR